jgi:hypothetical protein
MKLALIADKAMADPDMTGGFWLTRPLNSPDEWAEHLGRQLRITDTYEEDIQYTLLMLIPEIEARLNPWPRTSELDTWKDLAEWSTRDLPSIEVYRLLLAGPLSWRKEKVDCSVDRLGASLLRILEKSLASEIHRMIGQWIVWDVPKLSERRREAFEARKEAEAQAEAERLAALPRRPPPSRDPDRTKGFFTPRGRP